jgi:hypothetical protein
MGWFTMKAGIPAMLIVVLTPLAALADVWNSKTNVYSVVAPVQGSESVSKVNVYSVVAPVQGSESVSKVNVYSVVAPPQDSLSVSKVVVYSVIVPQQSQPQPNVYIFTRNDAGCESSKGFEKCFSKHHKPILALVQSAEKPPRDRSLRLCRGF